MGFFQKNDHRYTTVGVVKTPINQLGSMVKIQPETSLSEIISLFDNFFYGWETNRKAVQSATITGLWIGLRDKKGFDEK
jgi:hypothetical protein